VRSSFCFPSNTIPLFLSTGYPRLKQHLSHLPSLFFPCDDITGGYSDPPPFRDFSDTFTSTADCKLKLLLLTITSILWNPQPQDGLRLFSTPPHVRHLDPRFRLLFTPNWPTTKVAYVISIFLTDSPLSSPPLPTRLWQRLSFKPSKVTFVAPLQVSPHNRIPTTQYLYQRTYYDRSPPLDYRLLNPKHRFLLVSNVKVDESAISLFETVDSP